MARKNKILNGVVKGAMIGIFSNATANFLTWGNVEPKNIFIGGIVGVIVYFLTHQT